MKSENQVLSAVYNGDTDLLRRALAETPEAINARDAFTGATALIIAAGVGNYSCAEILVSRDGIDLVAKDNEGKDALDRALDLGHYALADLISWRIWPYSKLDSEDDGPSNVATLGPR